MWRRRKMKPPDHEIFGPDLDEAGVSYQSIAAQIKALKPRTLPPGSIEDVLLMLEWMQGELTRRNEELTSKGNELEAKQRELQAWHDALKIRQRTVDAVLKAGNRKRVGWFARRG
jgi:hypothetical protein